jgi:hypothetical protein
MFYIFLLISVVYGASQNECKQDQHTTAYKSCLDDGRPLQSLFIRNTFLNDDPCYPIDNTQYRKILSEKHIDQPDGFDVEHIIDVSNSIDGYLYILGNLILSNSSWNRGLGNFCWENVKNEKEEVYGDIFKEAYDNVQMCKKRGENISQFNSLYVITISVFFIEVVVGVIFVRKFLFEYINNNEILISNSLFHLERSDLISSNLEDNEITEDEEDQKL